MGAAIGKNRVFSLGEIPKKLTKKQNPKPSQKAPIKTPNQTQRTPTEDHTPTDKQTERRHPNGCGTDAESMEAIKATNWAKLAQSIQEHTEKRKGQIWGKFRAFMAETKPNKPKQAQMQVEIYFYILARLPICHQIRTKTKRTIKIPHKGHNSK